MYQPEQQLHTSAERLKVDHIVNGFLFFNVPENGHTDDGIYECDQAEQRADIEQCGQRHDQGEQKFSYTFGGLKFTIRYYYYKSHASYNK